MAYFTCPYCGKTREYSSDDLRPQSWNDTETFVFECKACCSEIDLEIEYDFAFYEGCCFDENSPFDGEILRFTPEEARKQYERENQPKKFSLGSRFSLSTGTGKFSLGSGQSKFSLSQNKFSLGNRKRRAGKILSKCKNKSDKK